MNNKEMMRMKNVENNPSSLTLLDMPTSNWAWGSLYLMLGVCIFLLFPLPEQDLGYAKVIASLCLVVYGLWLIIDARIATSIFDKNLESFSLMQKSLRDTRSMRCELKEIISVDVEELVSYSAESNKMTQNYILKIGLASGKKLPVSSYNKWQRQQVYGAAERIREYLNIC
jgi:hypothetical protein